MQQPKLYGLCDRELLDRFDITIEQFVERANRHNAPIIQYRDKLGGTDERKDALLRLKECYSGVVIINDDYTIADLCDGVHIGQEDLYALDSSAQEAIKILREIVGEESIIGLSTHNKEEIEVANRLNINYIGVGAYRKSSTKDSAQVLQESVDQLAKISSHLVAIIGGVRVDDMIDSVAYKVVGSDLYR